MGRKVLLAGLLIVSVCVVLPVEASASTPKPTIKSFSPTSGIAGKTVVTIDGTNLAHAKSVTFNGAPASIENDGAAKIRAEVPDRATTGDIIVKTTGGSARTVSKFVVTLYSSSTTTTPASSSIGIGYSNNESAVVSGNSIRGNPTGTVTFYECGPTASPESCTSKANQVGSPTTVTAGANDTSSASSVSFTASSTGYWCFASYYSGDSNYAPSSDTTTDECFAVFTPLDDEVSVVSDGGGYCALLTSSGVDCWGYGQDGEIGNGIGRNSASPVSVVGVGGTGTLTGVTSLVSGNAGYCVLLTSSGVDCWGEDWNGGLGNGTISSGGSPTPVEVVGVGGTGTLTGVASLFGGADGYCALLTSGGVDCWGLGENGELGNGTFYTTSPYGSDTPVAVVGVGGTGTLTGVASLVGGAGYCAPLTSGGVDCWGPGTSGALGNGIFSDSAIPVSVEGVGGTGTLAGVKSLVTDVSGYCALLTAGGVDCWGTGNSGQLGNGVLYTTGSDGSATPVSVEDVEGTGMLTRVKSVTSDSNGYCALLTSGGVDCWGSGANGTLGNSAFSDSATPVSVVGVGGSGTLAGVTSLVGDLNGSCALLTSGGVDCWGEGIDGELGNGAFYTTSPFGIATPIAVEGVGGTGALTGVTSLVSGSVSNCALVTSGIDCWGGGADGELGNGIMYTTGNGGSATPVEVG
jgi:alpha-tubulin suppressor-like RCC1 family protein